MKTTGVVRRIDDLGRIVIPKEIRRTLRIRDGESLEIFLDKDLIALKKYSVMNDLEDLAKIYTDAIYTTIKQNIFVTDRDSVIAATGSAKKKLLGKSISSFLEDKIDIRSNITEEELVEVEFVSDNKEKCSFTISPIIANGDPTGLVVIYSTDRPINGSEEAIAQIAAQFLGKHIEQ